MSAVLIKEIELTPDDIVQAMRALEPDELADLRQRLRDHGLILEWAARPSGELIQDEIKTASPVPDEEVPEFWKLIDVEPLPEPPPPTPEGDRIALEAVEWISGRFAITDPKQAHWLAESEEAAIYNAYLFYEKED